MNVAEGVLEEAPLIGGVATPHLVEKAEVRPAGLLFQKPSPGIISCLVPWWRLASPGT